MAARPPTSPRASLEIKDNIVSASSELTTDAEASTVLEPSCNSEEALGKREPLVAAAGSCSGSLVPTGSRRGATSDPTQEPAAKHAAVTTGAAVPVLPLHSRPVRRTRRTSPTDDRFSKSAGGGPSHGLEPTDELAEMYGDQPAKAMDSSVTDETLERRKQRRLAKNRATAALSRERKRVQMQSLSLRSLELEQENAYLKEALGMRNTEVAGLWDKLASMEASASLSRGADGSTWSAFKIEPAVLNGIPLPPVVPLLPSLLSAETAFGGVNLSMHSTLAMMAEPTTGPDTQLL
ncbi:hypothetical protein WJX73_001743 [Symbiochloris irregularis]|uniref:BZIP domain-containing protein n=1 Tax=Symbiochloris irregularis TaxID=706552 RepID=A0AAW1NPZ3_9CHLO